MEVCPFCGDDEYLMIVSSLDDDERPIVVRTCTSNAHSAPYSGKASTWPH